MFDANQKLFAQAGQKDTITIATNMAGRGTDIILGGNINFKIQKKLYDILIFAKNYKIAKNSNLLQSLIALQFKGISNRFLSVFSFFSAGSKIFKTFRY